MRNKFLAALLTLCMTSVMLPVSLFAEENVPAADDVAGVNAIEEVNGTADREEIYFADSQAADGMNGGEWISSEGRAAEEAEDITVQQEVVSGEDAEGKELIQLPTPTDLTWGIRTDPSTLTTEDLPGWIEWKIDDIYGMSGPGTHELYRFRIEIHHEGKNGSSTVVSSVDHRISNRNGGLFSDADFFMSEHLYESGIYYFTVQWMGDGEEYSDSEIAKSEIWEYQKPEAQLETSITKMEWEKTDFKWEYTGDMSYACSPQIEILFSETESGEPRRIVQTLPILDDRNRTTFPLADQWIQEHGKGYYYFRVRALSKDITKYQHGAWSELSPACNLTEVANAVSDSLAQILNDPSSSDPALIREQVKKIDRDDLRSAMLADPTILDQVQQLEEKITGNDHIKVEIDVQDSQIEENFHSDKIQIHGAKLNNPEAGVEKITLQIDRPKNENLNIPKRYRDTLAIKFSMDINGLEKNADRTLDVPVRITLPIPENINPKRLCILHYQSDDTFNPYVGPSSVYTYEGEDGQWYASFMLDHFSDFVMTEIIQAVVTFDANGGTCGTAALSVNDANTLPEIPVPARSGYKFDGWYMQNGTKVDMVTVFSEDTIVTAKWTQAEVNPPIVNPSTPTVPPTSPTVTPSVTPGQDVTPTPSGNTTPTPSGNVTPSPGATVTSSITPVPTETVTPDVTPGIRPKAAQILKSRYGSDGKRLKKKVGSRLTQVITGARTAVTFESSNPKVAKVGKTSGVIDLVGVGKAVIIAKAAESSAYKAAEKKVTIYVIPKTAGIRSIRSNSRGQVTVKSNNAAKGNDGYQLQYKHNGKTKKVTIKSKNPITKTFKNLKSKKSFKARIRAYKKADGKTYYGKYSKWKTLKKVR